MIVIEKGPKFNLGDSVSKEGAGSLTGYVIKVLPPSKYVNSFWYGVRWIDGNEDVYHEEELWLAV